MSLKSWIAKPYARWSVQRIRTMHRDPVAAQQRTLEHLVKRAQDTAFGQDHDFRNIHTAADFQERIPVRDYEGLKPYIDRIRQGEENVLWPGKPAYFCKTSGTTSGAKYIPLTKEAVPHHVNAAKMALLFYIARSGRADFLNGKMMFLQGSPTLDRSEEIPTGRLSGITAHWVPNYLQRNRMPSWETNCIEDWETKVDSIVDETLREDMRLISGIPSWVQMYFERLLEKSGKQTIAEVFPNFSLFVYGGVNYAPYRSIFRQLIGKDIPSVETYPASEGFIAYQDAEHEAGLLLNLDGGLFFEFIPAESFHDENPKRLTLAEVEVGKNYAVVLSSNAGLWGYNLGDTVKFLSTDPYRLIVTGRIKHFISAFGEHVIAEEAERSLQETLERIPAAVREFHLAPQVNPEEGLPYHEWFIEFEQEPHNADAFRLALDKLMQEKNPYYRDLIEGSILKPLVITRVQRNGFQEMMKTRGKLGGQNKIPRLANDRNVADILEPFRL